MQDIHSLIDEFGLTDRVAMGAWVEALSRLMPSLYDEADEGLKAKASRLRDWLLEQLEAGMRTSRTPPSTRMKFGTSGWRGLLLKDFTLHNVACVTQGLLDTLLDPSLHEALGVSSLAELKERGCVLAHDTRLFGREFCDEAARVLLSQGIPTTYLGMATTPEVSTAIAETKAAFSINFTPSHNPFDYHGYKFNPSDGGPAPATLTAPVARRANEILDGQLGYSQISLERYEAEQQDGGLARTADPIALYKQSLLRRVPWLNLEQLIEGINTSDMALFIDNGFGATQGKYEGLLKGVRADRLHIFNGRVDYLFGGRNREPSVENFRSLQDAMKGCPSRLAIGFMNDGDGDRFVGGGREAVLVMNRFGPLVVRYLSQSLGLSGDVTRSVMTSHMADSAQRRYQPSRRLNETAVGFQYMRPYVATSLNSFEESDGMSPLGWSLDKDGLMAALLFIAIVLHHQATPEELLSELERELGTFAFERTKVSGKLSGTALSDALGARFGRLAPGDKLIIEGRTFEVARRITLDGTKIVFNEGWWFGVRASGTEPVVRPYVETFTPPGASTSERLEASAWQRSLLNWLVTEVRSVIA